MAAAPDPDEVLRTTSGKTNFQRVARLLISGGTALLREVFDQLCPPSNLPTILNNPATVKQLKAAKLTKPQWDCLYPSPGVYGKSSNFDVTLLFRLLRTICNLIPPVTGWDALPASTDHSLAADLARIKYYRNSVYGHVNQNMEVTDEEFPPLWQEISGTLVGIASQISPAKKCEWQIAVMNFLKSPLTAEDERNVEELQRWYENETEVKKSLDELKTATQEGMERLETSLKDVQEEIEDKGNYLESAVREEAKGIKDHLEGELITTTQNVQCLVREEARDIKDKLGEMHQSIDDIRSSAGSSQAAGAQLRLRIDCEAISAPRPRGSSELVATSRVPQTRVQDAALMSITSCQQGQNTEGNFASEGLPTAEGVLNFIALKYFKVVDPSNPEELNGFLEYLTKVRKVLFKDAQQGSLLVTVECSSLEILEGLWEDYCSGRLNAMAQKYLVTEDILKEFGPIEVKLATTILEDEYTACRKHFRQSAVHPPSRYITKKTATGIGSPVETFDLKSHKTMSGVVETPVAKYGRSSEFGAVLDFILKMISNDTLRQAFNIPHLVMVGRQNMAKTTLINRLIGRYLLPMRRNETANTLQARTAYPIILNLRNGPKKLVKVKCDKRPDIGGSVEDPTDEVVENFLNSVTGHLPKEEGTPISKTPLNVTLQGPELTTLTLVDLPGVHFANDDPRMNHVTQSLVLEYIEKNINSIIVIVSEVGDPTGDSVINLVMQKAADFRNRTICALTKPDKLRESDDMGRRVATNQSSFTLANNRFILLRGKDGTDPNEKDWDAEMTRIKEMEWFARHPQYKDIQHVCGIDRLMDTMISLLAEKMITTIPKLVRDMIARKNEVDGILKELKLEDSEVPESDEGKGGMAVKLKHNLITELNKLLFNNTSDMEGGENVRQLFNSFCEAVFKVDPLAQRNDDDIRKQQKKLEGVAAPLGDSSENSQLLQKLLCETYTGYQSKGRQVKLPSPVDQLLPISEMLVQSVESTLRDTVQKAIESSLSKFPTLKKAVEAKVVNTIFDRKREQTILFIRQFLEMQKESVDLVFAPVPTPAEINLWETMPMKDAGIKYHPCMRSETMSQMKELAQKLYPQQLIDEIEGHGNSSPHTAFVNYKELEEMKSIKRNVVRCFNVLKMNVCDTVPRCILHFFVTQLVDDLGRALEKENLVEYLQERKDIRDKRIMCRKQSQALEEALPLTSDVLAKLLRMRHGFQ